MTDLFTVLHDLTVHFFEGLGARVTGPMKFRLILQPLVATIIAVRAGLADARQGRPAYFWAIFTSAEHRRRLLRDGWKDVGRVFMLAVVMDAIYQVIEERWIHPIEALIVAALLALVPYLLIRGPVNRIAKKPQR